MDCWLQHPDGSRVRVSSGGATLGCGLTSTFRVLDARVSTRHARVDIVDGGVFLTPREGALTGLNGAPLSHPKELRDGDWISLAPGVLVRVFIAPRRSVAWEVEIDGEVCCLSSDEPALRDGLLRLGPLGALLIQPRKPARRGEQVLIADGRAWALAAGDAVQLSDGTTVRVRSGPPPLPDPPLLALGGRLRDQPPGVGAVLASDGTLMLQYSNEDLFVTLGETEPLARALLVAGGEPVALEAHGGPAVLLDLRERLIAAGADGFALIVVDQGRARMPFGLDARVSVGGRVLPAPLHAACAWWLYGDDGSRWRLTLGGVLMGRHEECEVRLQAPYVHRHHALLRRQGRQVILSPLGRHPVYVNGAAIARPTLLAEGDELRVVPEQRMWIGRRPEPLRPVRSYMLELSGEPPLSVDRAELSIGGGSDDDVLVAGWSPGLLRLHRLPERLYVISSEDLTINGAIAPAGRPHTLEAGARLLIEGRVLRVVSVQPSGAPVRIRHIATQGFAQGGRLTVQLSDSSQRRLVLRDPLFQMLLLLLETAVGSRLRGVVRTQSSGSGHDDPTIPRDAMMLHYLRLELETERRLSLTTIRTLVFALQAAFVEAGLDGKRVVQLHERWARLNISPECSVNLYR